jgi:AcrR family transcriptional regulator
MAIKRERRVRDPEATRAAILAAARTLLARDGPEGLSVVQVAHLAGVNRGTAYQYFADRERLLHATVASVSEGLIDAVWSPSDVTPTGVRFTDKSVAGSAGRLAAFTAQNASFCKVWLFDLLSCDDPGSDPFSRAWFENVKAFCQSDDAVPGIDAEAYAAFTLTAYLCWPIWMHAEKLKPHARQETAQRLVKEVLRMAMYGVMKVEHFPTVRDHLAHEKPATAQPATAAPAR